MPAFHLDRLRVPKRRRRAIDSRIWREWCFARVVFSHIRWRILWLVAMLAVGGVLFTRLEPEKGFTFVQAMYNTWSLIFGEPPEAFPRHSIVLQSLFFLVPALGLMIIVEGLVDFALVLRDRRRSERTWCMTMSKSLSDHIVLIGLGRLGFQTFRLLRKLGESVVVIERSPDNQFLEDVRRDGSPLFICDARREAILEDVNIDKARSIILATTDDLANLEIALDARRLAPNIRVVLRMFDQNMADKIRGGFNIHLAMSQAALSAPTFGMAAVEPSIVSSIVVNDELVVMQRWEVQEGGPLCGKTVAQVLTEKGFTVVSREPQRGAAQLFPPPDAMLAAGDHLLVQGPYERLRELKRREKDGAPVATSRPT